MKFALFLALVVTLNKPAEIVQKFEDGSFLLTGCQVGHVCEIGSEGEPSYTLDTRTYENGMTIVLLCEAGQPCETSAQHSTYLLNGMTIEITREQE